MSKVPCVHWIVTPEAQISLRFALRPAVFEIQACRKLECTKLPQNDLKHWSAKTTLCTLNTHTRGPNFTPFRSTVARFPDNWGFWFPIGYDGEIEKKIVKNRKLKISKIQNNTFVRTTEKKIQKQFERIQEWFEGGVAFWSFGSHRVPC